MNISNLSIYANAVPAKYGNYVSHENWKPVFFSVGTMTMAINTYRHSIML